MPFPRSQAELFALDPTLNGKASPGPLGRQIGEHSNDRFAQHKYSVLHDQVDMVQKAVCACAHVDEGMKASQTSLFSLYMKRKYDLYPKEKIEEKTRTYFEASAPVNLTLGCWVQQVLG